MLAGMSEGIDITLPRFLQIVQHRGKSAGAIRVSLGLVSNFADVESFLQFAAGFRDQTALAIGAVTFDIEPCRAIRDGGYRALQHPRHPDRRTDFCHVIAAPPL